MDVFPVTVPSDHTRKPAYRRKTIRPHLHTDFAEGRQTRPRAPRGTLSPMSKHRSWLARTGLASPARINLIAAVLLPLVVFVAAACSSGSPPSGAGVAKAVWDQFERHPEAYRFAVDDDVVVRVAYPSEVIRWSWAAILTHIPTLSSIELDREGEVLRTHFQGGDGEARLRKALRDDATMARVRDLLAKIGDDTRLDFSPVR